MKSPPSPEKKGAGEDGRPDRHQKNRVNTGQILDSVPGVNFNGELLDISLLKVSRGRKTHYEVEHGQCRWTFNSLFPGTGKFERLVLRIGGANRP
jgi:hypothetical protein